jgi:hypothetical protein
VLINIIYKWTEGVLSLCLPILVLLNLIVAGVYCQRKKLQREPRELQLLLDVGESSQGEAQTGLLHTNFQRQ